MPRPRLRQGQDHFKVNLNSLTISKLVVGLQLKIIFVLRSVDSLARVYCWMTNMHLVHWVCTEV